MNNRYHDECPAAHVVPHQEVVVVKALNEIQAAKSQEVQERKLKQQRTIDEPMHRLQQEERVEEAICIQNFAETKCPQVPPEVGRRTEPNLAMLTYLYAKLPSLFVNL